MPPPVNIFEYRNCHQLLIKAVYNEGVITKKPPISWLNVLGVLAILTGLCVTFMVCLSLVGRAYMVFTPSVLAFYLWTAWSLGTRNQNPQTVGGLLLRPGYDIVMSVIRMYRGRTGNTT